MVQYVNRRKAALVFVQNILMESSLDVKQRCIIGFRMLQYIERGEELPVVHGFSY